MWIIQKGLLALKNNNAIYRGYAMKTLTFAQGVVLNRIKEKMDAAPIFQDYSEHSDYSEYGDYGDSSSDWT